VHKIVQKFLSYLFRQKVTQQRVLWGYFPPICNIRVKMIGQMKAYLRFFHREDSRLVCLLMSLPTYPTFRADIRSCPDKADVDIAETRDKPTRPRQGQDNDPRDQDKAARHLKTASWLSRGKILPRGLTSLHGYESCNLKILHIFNGNTKYTTAILQYQSDKKYDNWSTATGNNRSRCVTQILETIRSPIARRYSYSL